VPKIVAQNFVTGPYLTWATGQDPSNATTVMWVTSFNENSGVHYGTSRLSLDHVATGAEYSRFHHVAIGGLLANTTYYYQVGGYPVKQFTTAPVGTFNYSFCVWSDHRTNTDITISNTQANIVEKMSAMVAAAGIDPAFSMFCGDLTSASDDYLGWKTWFDDTAYHDWSVNRSLGIAFGNHERYGDNDTVNVQEFYPYTKQADGHFYRSFDYGNAHFIVLDPYLYNHNWATNFTASQLAWLKSDLAAHKGANFTVIFMHPPPWALAGVKGEFIKLAPLYHIDLVFCGHQHIFNLQNITGTSIRVMTIGLGGVMGNAYKNFPCQTAFARVEVSAIQMHVIAQFTNGTKLNEFSIHA